MFKSIEESRVLWFDGDSFSPHNEYELVGTCLGMAIYNAVILDLHFPVSYMYASQAFSIAVLYSEGESLTSLD